MLAESDSFYLISASVCFIQVWILVGVYIAMATPSLLIIALFVDNIPLSWLPEQDRDMGLRERVCHSMTATIRLLTHLDLLLLVPIVLFVSINGVFFDADFNKVSFISSNGV